MTSRILPMWLALVSTLTLSAFSQTVSLQHNSNLRQSASTSSAIIELLSTGTRVTLLSNKPRSGYYHVRTGAGSLGWVWAKNVSLQVGKGTTREEMLSAHVAEGQPFDPGCALPFDPIKEKHPIIDDSCSIDGTKRGGGNLSDGKLSENHVKNNFCVTATPIDISYDDLLQLEAARANVHDAELPNAAARKQQLTNVIKVNGRGIGEGTLVRLVIFLIEAHYSDTKTSPSQTSFGESVNCYRPSNEENDIHIVLGQQTHADECTSVTAEMSPHYRPAKWTQDNVNAVGEHPVRVTGQLFYDSSHVVCQPGRRTAPKRASLWEIHPVYGFEVCQLTDIEACRSAANSEWQPLDRFVP
jgi:hypothetical protein